MIAITTSSSMSVKPALGRRWAMPIAVEFYPRRGERSTSGSAGVGRRRIRLSAIYNDRIGCYDTVRRRGPR